MRRHYGELQIDLLGSEMPWIDLRKHLSLPAICLLPIPEVVAQIELFEHGFIADLSPPSFS